MTDRVQVALLAPEIPWNTGNVGRTCLASGAALHLIRPLGFSLEDRYLKRAGLDYWQHVRPRIWPAWTAFEAQLPNLGEPFFFSAEADRDLWSVRFGERPILSFGSETSGLPAEVRGSYAERLVSIPMRDGPIRSLNLSTAAAVAVYEARRQLRARIKDQEIDVPD